MESSHHPPAQAVRDAVSAHWSCALVAAACPVCQQAHLVDEARLGMRCPSCARGQLEPQPVRLRSEPPERIIPFQHNQSSVQPILDKFVRKVWLRPDDFSTENLLQRMEPVFVPMWLVDGDVFGTWESEVGFDYQVKSSQESYSSSGEWVSHEVIETRIRWEPRVGLIERHYDNLAVVALSTHNDLLQLVGGYDQSQAVAYDVALLNGATIRVPDVEPDSAWEEAQVHFAKAAARECQQAISADHIRSFSIKADYETLVWTLLLQPLFVSSYADDDGVLHPIYMNGVTGRVGGIRMASQRKGWMWAGILAGVALVLLLIGAGLLLLQAYMYGASAETGTVGAGFIVLASLLCIAALVPAVMPWVWNREQREREVVRG